MNYNAGDMAIIESDIENFHLKAEELFKLEKQKKLEKAEYKKGKNEKKTKKKEC